jgi:predicted unusual protein kinase regulating ubiquinone biosynthesis (AarF/ABC1/UbiB family)/nucleotide-binding universal stress UspA family protein
VVERILVATDRSDDAGRTVEWAAEMAERYAAELLVLQVVAPEHIVSEASGAAAAAAPALDELAERLAGERGRARLVYDSDPSEAIVRVAEEERADIVVVGNLSMSDRSEFLLASVPNRVSHNARCTVVIVNAVEAAPTDSPTREHEPRSAEATEGELLGRAAQIARVVAKYGLGNLLDRGRDGDTAAARARRFRSALEELGPTFAKLGQILSTRPDLLPTAFMEELSTLQDQVTPLAEAEVVAVMERELRVPWEDVFVSIEPDPMAAGTIAQVHRAVLADGERVVVKVQRPTAEREILHDLGLLERFAAKAGDRPAFRQLVDVPAIIEHLSTSLRRELDFRHEAANIERMRAVLAPFYRLDVPRVYDELSTAGLLVMEEVQGIPIREAPAGEARKQAARELLESYYQQVLTDGFFHADPHPGNLMWWNDKIYLLDLGMTGEVEPKLRESLLLLLLAFWQEDIPFLADVMLALSGEPPQARFDASAFEAELGELVSGYRHLSLRELRLGPLLQQLTEISVRHDVRLPAALALVGKAFGQMQLTAAELDPSLDPFSVAGSFFLRRVAGQVRTAATPRRLFYEAEKLRVRAVRALEGVERLVGLQPGAGLRVDLEGNHDLDRAIGQASRRLAVGLAAGAALVATAVTASAAHAAGWLAPTFGVVAALLTSMLLVDVLRRS